MNNIQAVKDIYAAFLRGDIPYILAQMADDVIWEFEGPPEVPYTGIMRGPEQASFFFRGLMTVENPGLVMNEFVAMDDKVVALGRFFGTVKRTGKSLNVPVAHYWVFRDGKVAHYRNFAPVPADAYR